MTVRERGGGGQGLRCGRVKKTRKGYHEVETIKAQRSVNVMHAGSMCIKDDSIKSVIQMKSGCLWCMMRSQRTTNT